LPSSFGAKLEKAFAKYGQLCVGIDPHASLLEDWGLADSADGLRDFSMRALDAAVGRVGVIKPQVSFFERFGSAGFAVLEELANRASQTDLVVIMDAKRGDIGTTMDAYHKAWLGKTAPFVCDALTVSPYLGFDSLKPMMSECLENGKGVIVLSATSNPEGAALQKATSNSETVAASIWRSLSELNAVTAGPAERFGSFGAVLGATLNLNGFGLQAVMEGQPISATPILAPGFGAQGAQLSDSRQLFGAGSAQVIHSVSRSVLQAGPAGMPKAIDAAVTELAAGLAN
jgi:orotidine-5'-phosphate decarboxylase